MRAAKNVVPDARFKPEHAAVLMRRGLRPVSATTVSATTAAPRTPDSALAVPVPAPAAANSNEHDPTLAVPASPPSITEDDELIPAPLSPPRRTQRTDLTAAPPSTALPPTALPPTALPPTEVPPTAVRLTWSSDPWLLSPTRALLSEQTALAFARRVTVTR